MLAGTTLDDRTLGHRTKKLTGRTVQGTVTAVLEHGLALELDLPDPSLPRRGFVHAAQCFPETLADADLAGHFPVGCRVTTKIASYSLDHGSWKTSIRSALKEQAMFELGLVGRAIPGVIRSIKNDEVILQLGEGLIGHVPAALFRMVPDHAERKVGDGIQVKISHWVNSFHGPLLVPSILRVCGVVQDLRTSLTHKDRKLKATLAVYSKGFGVQFCDVSGFMDPHARFPVGAAVEFLVETGGEDRSAMTAVALGGGRAGAPVVWTPPTGPFTTQVVRTIDYGAFCLVADHVAGLLHAEGQPDPARRLAVASLSPGDSVRVRIVEPDPGRNRYGLELLEVLERRPRPAAPPRPGAPD
jgi:predicted RNA-binding protein with RPS1 domain